MIQLPKFGTPQPTYGILISRLLDVVLDINHV